MRFPYWDGNRVVDPRNAQSRKIVDPFEAIEDPFDKIEHAAEALARRMTWEQGNRIGLLRTHAAIGILSGLQMLLFGGSAVIENTLGLWTRPLLGFLGIIGGLTLLTGLMKVPRSIIYEATGLSLLATWDGLMSLGFIIARWRIHNFDILPLNTSEPIPPVPYVPPYAISVYSGLCVLVLVHLWTLWKFKKSPTSLGDVK